MSYIPAAMNPAEIMDKRTLFDMRTCAGCGANIPAAVGVLYEHTYIVNDQQVYGHAFWCSFQCILETTGEDGHA